jgi:hypothetical protein
VQRGRQDLVLEARAIARLAQGFLAIAQLRRCVRHDVRYACDCRSKGADIAERAQRSFDGPLGNLENWVDFAEQQEASAGERRRAREEGRARSGDDAGERDVERVIGDEGRLHAARGPEHHGQEREVAERLGERSAGPCLSAAVPVCQA